MRQHLYLFVILLLAWGLRFWQLGNNPPELTWDEAAWGYNAYTLGLNGRDEFGRFLPLDYLESFGDFKPPLYAYLAILPIKFWGLTPFAVRFPSAVVGVLMVVGVYFLVKTLFEKDERVELWALLTSLVVAISPWHIMLSRAAFEANVAGFLIMTGVWFFMVGLRKKFVLVVAVIFFVLACYTFNTARVVAPLLGVILSWSCRQRLWQSKRWVVLAAAVTIFLLIPLVPFLLTPQASLRYREVNIFSEISLIEEANQAMINNEDVWWSKIIHNRRWYYLQAFLQHYFDNLNPSFLFFRGDGNPKFSTRDVGLFYWWEVPFLLMGLLWLVRGKPTNWWLIPVWLMLGILPAAVARETPHALRIENSLPAWQILTAYGLSRLWFRWRWPVLVIALAGVIYFQHGYWRHYAKEFSGEWQYGYREAIDFIKENQQKYQRLWFTDKLGRPYIYFLFYLQYDPQRFVREAKVEREVWGFVKVRSFDRYHFFNERKEIEPKGRTLVVEEFEKIPPEIKAKKVFYLLNGKPVLAAYEI